MPRPILVGYDGSAASQRALAHAAERCAAMGRPMVLCTVVPAGLRHVALSEMLLPGIELNKLIQVDQLEATARNALEQAAAGPRGKGVQVEVMVRRGDAADELLEGAREAQAEEVVLGYMSYEHKLPLGIGSVAEKVLRYADRTVTVVRAPGERGPGPRASEERA